MVNEYTGHQILDILIKYLQCAKAIQCLEVLWNKAILVACDLECDEPLMSLHWQFVKEVVAPMFVLGK